MFKLTFVRLCLTLLAFVSYQSFSEREHCVDQNSTEWKSRIKANKVSPDQKMGTISTTPLLRQSIHPISKRIVSYQRNISFMKKSLVSFPRIISSAVKRLVLFGIAKANTYGRAEAKIANTTTPTKRQISPITKRMLLC